jgi:hypothetical protein
LIEKKKSPPPSNYDYANEPSSDGIPTAEVIDPSAELKKL